MLDQFAAATLSVLAQVPNPGQGKKPPGSEKFLTILAVERVARARHVRARRHRLRRHHGGPAPPRPRRRTRRSPRLGCCRLRGRRLSIRTRRNARLRGTRASQKAGSWPTRRHVSRAEVRGLNAGSVLAAAFLAVVILAALLIFVTSPGSDDGGSSSAPKEDANGVPPAGAKDRDASVCGLPAGGQQVPAVPPEADWELVGTIAAPTARVTGPGIQEGKRRLCFAHSPTGALFAAVNFVAIAGFAPNDTELLRELTAGGRARDELLRQGSEPADPSFRMQVAGFRLDTYLKRETTVDLALRTSEHGALLHVALPLHWERGDWKVVVAAEQGPFAAIERLDNLSGYVPWSGA